MVPSAPPGRPSRRDEILAAAARMFAARGFHGVGMDEIGAAVGISGPALYRYFPGKEALLAAMLVPISERLLAEGRRRAAAAAGPTAALGALVRWHTDFALGNPDVITVQDRELDNLPVDVSRRVRQLQRSYVEEWVAVLLELSPGLGEPAARAAVHSVFGLLNSTPHSAGGLDRDAMAALLHRMALAALTSALPDRQAGKRSAGRNAADSG